MPNIKDLKNSKFLTKNDCEPAILVTIKGCEEMDVSLESDPTDMKWCLAFEEQEKPMVLNITNGQIIAAITGQDETDEWIGQKIVLYNDPNVTYAGKLTGGIRARAMKTAGPQMPDDIPF